MLLVVGGEMLDGGAHVFALHALDVGRGDLAGQVGILGEVFKVAAAEGAALDVHRGAQHHGELLVLAGIADGLAHAGEQRPVEACRRGAGRGEAHRFDGVVHAQVVGGLVLLAQAVGAVGHHRGRDAQALHRLGVPEVRAGAQAGLFLEGHLGDEGFDVHGESLLSSLEMDIAGLNNPSVAARQLPLHRGAMARVILPPLCKGRCRAARGGGVAYSPNHRMSYTLRTFTSLTSPRTILTRFSPASMSK